MVWLIQPEEKESIRQCVCLRCQGGHGLLSDDKELVAEKLNIPWVHIHLQRTSKGKQVLVKDSLNPRPNFNLNMSHQGDYVVLAAEPELQIGIDSMKTSFPGLGSIPEFLHIMKESLPTRSGKQSEVLMMNGLNWMFYQHWALEDNFIKVIGVALGFEMQWLEFVVSPLNMDAGQVYKETRLILDGEEEKENGPLRKAE